MAKSLSAWHERVLFVATIYGKSQSSYRAGELKNFMGRDAVHVKTNAIAMALRHLAHEGKIRQVGPGQFAASDNQAGT